MKEFFSSVRFKILLCLAVVLCAFMLRAAWTGGFGTVASSLLGAITTPLQQVSAGISDKVDDFFSTFVEAKQIKAENEKLREENQQLIERQKDYDQVKHENEVYKGFLEIKERNPDLVFEPASVIGRDASDRFYSFTIDRGTLDDVDVHDCVITSDGLVGVIYEVGLTYAKVSTILDPYNNIGVYDTRTRDTALVTGTTELAERGLCKMYLLPRESAAAVGDLVVTSGVSGNYPKDQTIGKIVEVGTESHGNSLYAVVQPTADIRNVKDVLVIRSFAGQGSSSTGPVWPAQSSAPEADASSSQAEEPDGQQPLSEAGDASSSSLAAEPDAGEGQPAGSDAP